MQGTVLMRGAARSNAIESEEKKGMKAMKA